MRLLSGGLSMNLNKDRDIYVMYNEETKVKVESTERYVDEWIKRGFKIIEIKEGAGDNK